MKAKHPAERGGRGRGPFDEIADAASNFTSTPAFFVVCLALLGLWAASYLGGASKTWQHVAGDTMAAVTLALVALLKNAERRSEHAVQQKLDLIAAALLEGQEGDVRAARERLRDAIGLHDEV